MPLTCTHHLGPISGLLLWDSMLHSSPRAPEDPDGARGLGGKSGVQALPPSLHAWTSLGSSATTAHPSLG